MTHIKKNYKLKLTFNFASIVRLMSTKKKDLLIHSTNLRTSYDLSCLGIGDE